MIKYFPANIIDNYGMPMPSAYLAINSLAFHNITTLQANHKEGKYDKEVTLEKVSYNVNAWFSKQVKDQGYRSRPIFDPTADSFGDHVFEVEIEDFQTIYDQTPGTHEDKTLTVCVHHFTSVIIPKLKQPL